MALLTQLLHTLTTHPITLTIALLILIAYSTHHLLTHPSTPPTVPVSVNYHFTRKCNKTCGFCFHTEKTSHVLSQADIFTGLRLLKAQGMQKINFAGGEPFLYPQLLGIMCRFCKEELALESVSIITNGTKVSEKWVQEWGRYVDVRGVSCKLV